MSDVTCQRCGKKYSVNPYRLAMTKYCSRLCLSRANAESKRAIPKFKCITCGKMFHRSKSNVKVNGAKYCSKKCYTKRQGEFISGENHYKWKGGIKHERFGNYFYPAKKRGLVFELTENEFLKYWQKPCHYCGNKIETIGLDRVDNTKGYTKDNIVPCCEICNRMKLTLGRDVFLNHIAQIADWNNKKIVNSIIGANTKTWHHVNIYNSTIGENCNIGSYVEIGNAVLGNNVSVGAHGFICEGIEIEDDCFIGPRFTGTNDRYPPSGKDKWQKTRIKKGARVGAGVTVICGVTIGEYALVGAGSVVTKSIGPAEKWCGVPAKKMTEKE